MKLINTIRSALDPGNFAIMSKKVLRRFGDRRGTISKEQNLEWLRSYSSPVEEIMSSIDKQLFEETRQFESALKVHAKKIMETIKYDLGGGGCYPLLYFLTRHLKPECVVETGVASGYSSCAFLHAMEKNGKGTLYSSDFPYFRLPNPQKYIGILVEERFRPRWKLFFRGDDKNLPAIIDSIQSIDLFHYDSDKSYSGRQSALTVIEPKMAKNAILIVDDIQDNAFFYDYITVRKITAWRVTEFEKKYLGIVGPIGHAESR